LDGVTATTAELNLVDGSSAGTIVNNKAVVYSAAGQVNATQLALGGTAITSTAAEINILDGVTATAAEINILDGVTATAAELNYNDITTLGTVEASKTVTADASGDVLFPDGDKAIFGAGSDLEIYHDGTNNRLTLASANTYIQTDGIINFTDIGNNEKHLTINDDGAVDLYHNNALKLATSATGVTVTGTVAATAYTGDGSALTGVGGSTTYGAVGTYALCNKSGSTVFPGNTTSGADLLYASAPGFTTGSAPSGTWKVMGYGRSGEASTYLRIS
jgi:hypothetical protein